MPTNTPEEGREQQRPGPGAPGEGRPTTGSAGGEGERTRPAGAPQGQKEETEGRQASIRGAREAPRGQRRRSAPAESSQDFPPTGDGPATPTGHRQGPAYSLSHADSHADSHAEGKEHGHDHHNDNRQDHAHRPEPGAGATVESRHQLPSDAGTPVQPPPEPAPDGPHGAAQPDFQPETDCTPPPQPGLRQFKSQKAKNSPSRPAYPLREIVRLLDHGAHLVLCAPWGATRTTGKNGADNQPVQDKRPLWRNWQRRRPTLDQLRKHAEHRGLIAVIPASLGCTALDVDQGSPVPLLVSHPPRFVFRSLNPGRLHAWYPTGCTPNKHGTHACADPNCPARPGDFRFQPDTEQACQGQVVGHNAYVILWNTALSDLADALDHERRFPHHQSPHDIRQIPLYRPDQQPVTPNDAEHASAPTPASGTEEDIFHDPRRPTTPDLGHVRPGHRNTSLFHHVRHPAYALRRHYQGPNTYPAYLQAVTSLARQARLTIPNRQGFPQHEADQVARSIAQWSWTHINPGYPTNYTGPRRNHQPEIQRQRRANRTRQDQQRMVARQDLAHCHQALGLTTLAIARALQISTRTAQRDLKAIASQGQLTPSRRQARRTLQTQFRKTNTNASTQTRQQAQSQSHDTNPTHPTPHPSTPQPYSPTPQNQPSHEPPPRINRLMSQALPLFFQLPPPRPP